MDYVIVAVLSVIGGAYVETKFGFMAKIMAKFKAPPQA
jgi:hypothetical protein